MAHIESTISANSEAFQANRDGMLALIERVREYEQRSVAKSAASRPRFEKRNQLLPRERLSLLGVPVVDGLPAGHGDQNIALPFGRTVAVDGHAGTLIYVD